MWHGVFTCGTTHYFYRITLIKNKSCVRFVVARRSHTWHNMNKHITFWRTYYFLKNILLSQEQVVRKPLTEETRLNDIWTSRFVQFCWTLLWLTGTPFTHTKAGLKFLGLPRKLVWYVRGLPWKHVGNFGSRNGCAAARAFSPAAAARHPKSGIPVGGFSHYFWRTHCFLKNILLLKEHVQGSIDCSAMYAHATQREEHMTFWRTHYFLKNMLLSEQHILGSIGCGAMYSHVTQRETHITFWRTHYFLKNMLLSEDHILGSIGCGAMYAHVTQHHSNCTRYVPFRK